METSILSPLAKSVLSSKKLKPRSPKYRLYKRLTLSISLSLAAGCLLVKAPSIAAPPLQKDILHQTQNPTVKPSTSTTKLPTTVAQAVMQDATKVWGLTSNTGKVVNAKPIAWAYGCERSTFPYPCDPVIVKGWQVAIASGPQRWVYHTNTNGSLVRLYTREIAALDTQIPAKVKDAVVKLGATHLSLSSSQLLFTQVEKQTWPSSCLGLPSPVERCMQGTTPGWRVTVEGTPGQKQIYRLNSTGQQIRTEAIAGLPARTDQLPTATAKLILKNASDRLKVPMSQLYILQAERHLWSNYCLDLENPGLNCAQSRLAGWRVSINGAGRSLVYRIDDAVSQIRIEPPSASQSTQLRR
jgi:hypothetical protein